MCELEKFETLVLKCHEDWNDEIHILTTELCCSRSLENHKLSFSHSVFIEDDGKVASW